MDDTPQNAISLRATIAICGSLLAIFGILSFTASRTKSPTFDESLHAVAGEVYLEKRDFRINPEHPPLWKMWSALGQQPLTMDFNSPDWTEMSRETGRHWKWTVDTLF